MRMIFLVEEPSMKEVLNCIIPKILPGQIEFRVYPHRGKGEMRKSLPILIRSWTIPEDRFVVVQDQDQGDCREVKRQLKELCAGSRKPVLIRIACRELESWYFGDLKAVSLAYGKDYTYLENKSRYRVPDNLTDPKAEIYKLCKGHQQIAGARLIGSHMEIDDNRSTSFNAFVSGVRRLAVEMLG